MPVYEYECQSCRRVHEVLQKFSDLPLAKCPDCGEPVRKLMSLSSFALKGSGWYVTDYKKSGAPAPAPAMSTDSGESPSANPAKTESKPAAPAASPSPAASPAPAPATAPVKPAVT